MFHDRGYPNITGDPLNDPNRRTRVQKIYWKADGTLDLGIPVPDGLTPVRLRGSVSGQEAYVRYYTNTSPSGAATLADQLFRIITPGLAGGNSVSLESASRPGLYLRRSGTQVRFDAGGSGSSATFKSEASWNRKEGLADGKGVSFEAAGGSGQYLMLTGTNGGLVVAAVGGDEGQRGQGTFYLD